MISHHKKKNLIDHIFRCIVFIISCFLLIYYIQVKKLIDGDSTNKIYSKINRCSSKDHMEKKLNSSIKMLFKLNS